MTAQDVYLGSVTVLPASEQLRLAALILAGLNDAAAALDYSDHWSDEDVCDLVAFSSAHAGAIGDEQ